MVAPVSVPRSAATACLGAVATALLVPETLRLSGAAAQGSVETLGPDHLVATGALLVGTAGAAWVTVASTLLAALALARATGAQVPHLARVAGALAPRVLQRLLVVGVGAVVGLAPQVAAAAEVDLGWTASEATTEATPRATHRATPITETVPVSAPIERPPGPRDGPTASPATPAEARATAVTVERGDSLWRLTREQLARARSTAPTDAEVAGAWPALWAANRAVVGDDPDLLHPGQVLILPPVLRAASDLPMSSDLPAQSATSAPVDVHEENR